MFFATKGGFFRGTEISDFSRAFTAHERGDYSLRLERSRDWTTIPTGTDGAIGLYKVYRCQKQWTVYPLS